jgi:Acetyl-CoA hydrolase/transferase C-terminal domain
MSESASEKPVHFSDPAAVAETIIARVGRRIVLALPLGLGKANHIVNALVERAINDAALHLTIVTALTLEVPHPAGELERRFYAPATARLFGDYPTLRYAQALRDGSLPDNIEVEEFFLLAGRWRSIPRAQQRYISANYTDALGYLLQRGVNVVAQLIAADPAGTTTHYSLSCNPDITPDLLRVRQRGDAPFLFVGQLNSQLPYMSGGEALVAADAFDLLLSGPLTDFELYSLPARPVSLPEWAIGLHAARLIVDGGTLQIGIGSIGDALARALILRQRDNALFRRLATAIDCSGSAALFDDGPFETGLYGASEMLVEGFVHLEQAGVIKRSVDGALVHAGFFLGSRDFYSLLRDMPEAHRRRFAMMPVSFTNTLLGDVDARRRARVHARFVNNAMIATLLGAVTSDGTEDGRVVSGVGGQFDFVEQAFALPGARSLIALNATRGSGARLESNIRYSYGHTTIPRHRRDIVVTEYGVADLRGRSDADVIAAMLAISDSRFQDELLDSARRTGKIPRDYQIPERFRDNTPQRLREALGAAFDAGTLPRFPWGSDFTDVEQRLLPALQQLQDATGSRSAMLQLLWQGIRSTAADHAAELRRLQLDRPAQLRDWVYRWLVLGALGA